jgi:hypothetical protein
MGATSHIIFLLFSFVLFFSALNCQNNCFLATSCSSCAQQNNCGWCSNCQICLPLSTINVPGYGQISTQTLCTTPLLCRGTWITTVGSCPNETPCRQQPNCTKCLTTNGCGFCSVEGLGACFGSNFGSLCGSMASWSPSTCPVPSTCVQITNKDGCITTPNCGYCETPSGNSCVPDTQTINTVCTTFLNGKYTPYQLTTTSVPPQLTTAFPQPPPAYQSSARASNRLVVIVGIVLILLIVVAIGAGVGIVCWRRRRANQQSSNFLVLNETETETDMVE